MMMQQPASVISDNSNMKGSDLHGVNRQIADFGIQGKPVQNVQ